MTENTIKVILVKPMNAPEVVEIPHTLRGRSEEITAKIESAKPLFYDVIHLSLEEIFIYELGGENYAVKDFVL